MTKAELDQMTDAQREYYFEWEYPYVLPENDVFQILNEDMTGKLSGLESAYVQWMLEVFNRELAVDKFIHPAHYFDKERYGAKYLKNKPEIADLLRRIRRECPYLKLYTGDYLTGLLHDEIQYLRSQNRKDRFYGPLANALNSVGKKTPHDQEMEEIDRLLECLKQVHELKMAAGGFASASPGAQQNDVDRSFDRIVARTKELINGRKDGDGGGTERPS